VKNPILKDPLIMARALEDPYLNIEIGLKYLAWLRARYRAWPPYVTFAAYNLGPSRMDVLLKRPGFRPDETWVYFKSIERRVGYYRTLELDWETTRISL
jgi:soluble lytic murein transglycosylase-like protein